mmetsp:Transcript_37727/g.121973  ORF Transcript_37727/g.121973 Transcript_37727/m.121973 type:complete len:173 (-) Transcript_37727:179-697(-)
MVVLVGTAVFALASAAVCAASVPRCYERPLAMRGDESDDEIDRLARGTAAFSRCSAHCMRGQMELGRADLNTPSWAKVAMLGALFKTAEDCMPDFEANGLAAPGADGTGWLPAPLRAIPTGAALVELGMKCGVEARQRGCDVNTFGSASMLATAVGMAWLQVCLVLVLRHSS